VARRRPARHAREGISLTTASGRLAIDGGVPVRIEPLPYGRHCLDEDDIAAVVQALRSGWLTTGPRVAAFEEAFACTVGAREAVAVSSGTAALHAAMFAVGVGAGDEVIVPTLTFAASASCALFQGAQPVFADVDAETLLINPADVERRITPRTRAIVAVDYTGQPCDYDALQALATRHGLHLIADAAHSLGATYRDRSVGTLGDLTTFSLHPVKHMTTGEGGMVTTDDPALAARMRRFRNHGISLDHRDRQTQGSWVYEIDELGYNYRLTDVQCALGLSQLSKAPQWLERRRALARYYDGALTSIPAIAPLTRRPDRSHAFHLYVGRLDLERLRGTRAEVFAALRAEGIGVNVHYIPVHLHALYRERCGTGPGQCPVAERAYEEMLTLPLFPHMTDRDAAEVMLAVRKVFEHFAA
jgi:perosamine synthetase